MGICRIIENQIRNHIGQLNTLMLCKVISKEPLELLPYYEASYEDNEKQQRTKIQEPLLFKGASYDVDDIVLVGFLQEVNEDGAIRKFDISDAVIIGKVDI